MMVCASGCTPADGGDISEISGSNVETVSPVQASDSDSADSDMTDELVQADGQTQNAEQAQSDEPAQPDYSNYIQLAPTHIYTNKVLYSENDYFYKEAVTVSMTLDCVSEGAIRYTLDGSAPDRSSNLYSEPITIEPATNGGIGITTLRAAAFFDDGTNTEATSHCYYVGESVESRYSTVVINISGSDYDFYDYNKGILSSKNRYARGRYMEKEVFVTVLSADGSLVFEQNCGVRLIGGDSRLYPAPSLKLYARKDYSPERGYFPFDLFETPRYDKEGKIVAKYDKLVLRTNGDDSQSTMMRDVLMHRLAQNAGFENYEAAVPAVVYINGEYYNLVWIRENYCDEYFKNKYGDADGTFVVAEECEKTKHYNSTADEMEMKACNEYNAMYKKYAYSDLTDEANYAALCTAIDVEDYLRYYAIECYAANTDWPNNNNFAYRYYPAEGEEAGEGVFDGRWRYLLHDLDYSTSIYNAPAGNGPSYNMWKVVMTPEASRYSPLFTALMKREDCRTYFINYTYELADHALSGQSVREVIAGLREDRDGELPYFMEYLNVLKKRYQRGETTYAIFMTEASHEKSVANLIDFFDKRGEYAKKYLTELFGEK